MSDFDTLVRLADNLYARYEAQGNPSDLSLCIVHYRSALTLARSSNALSNDTQSKLLSNLANALSIRFQRHGDLADLDHSVECHLTALDFRPPGHPGRANTLSNFATALLIRYGKLGVEKDIELAIGYFHTALSMLPPEGRLMALMNYASALVSRFQHTGDVSDLSDAIRQYYSALDFSPAENKSTAYYNLANAILSRFKLENNPKDLELCIEYSSIALQGMSDAHPDRLLALSCLSSALIRRFEWYGNAEDLQTAVNNFQSALDLRSAEDSSQFIAFYDLADALVLRYKHRDDLADLELAIEHYHTALDLLPPSHKDEGFYLDNLGSALFLRFSRLGAMNDLEEAIQKHYFALEIHTMNLSRRLITLEALGECLDVRFEQSRDPEDLHTAIDLYNEALFETSQDHPLRAAILKKCANSLETRFRIYGGIVDLDRSISYCREALELLPPDHLGQATSYQTLASTLLLRFEETGDEFDLEEAHLYCSTATNTQHASGSLRAACNLLLARILKARILPWEVKDIESIFQHLRLAKDLCTLGHSLISEVYAELASTYYLRFLVEQRPSDLNEAFGHHELSMSFASGPSCPAIRTCLQWVRDAEMFGHRSGIDVYRSTLRLVNCHILALRSPELQQHAARRYGASLAYEGASFAMRFQEPTEAIEVLEGGRSVLWSQLVRAQTCLDDLRLTGESGVLLADDFERLSFQLDQLPRVSKSSKDVKFLLKEKEAVVEQIRRVEGFKSFLKSIPFSELEKAALEGPVIILNASQHACDALILQFNTPHIHVPLPHVTFQDVSQMATRFRELTGNPVTSGNDDEALTDLLSDLWDLIYPIIQHLLLHIPMGSRIWWCPAGPFASIPLHAAGPYRQGEPSLLQIYVSSYTPTLQALIRARARTASEPSRSRRSSIVPGFLKGKKSKQTMTNQTIPTIVAIGHTTSDETCYELDFLRNRIPPSAPFRRIEGEEVTLEVVLAAFREPVWLHLACAASVDAALPGQSGFATRDGTLSLYDISSARPRAEFAFLSGRCERGDDAESEEMMMHLVAALQYSGVRSVIGTLWPVDDEVMGRVAAAFYEEIILKPGGSMQYTNTARSLNEALKAVGKEVPLAQQIAFVHVGA
ncbi:CHAT domain-containing protein [Boletus edulis BED1]|uniref:CHAT domain-containing protein n=1 Tax=Boletus edulis BED1 TaxID=1328754 RepID=A0AAD4BYK3_BOLED|nr:CHAT domain-containing protein [Boletus edulis BED1]